MIASFLHDRTQMVLVNGKALKSEELLFCVPQGYILGQLLIGLYIKDISCKNENSADYFFADDNAIKTRGNKKTTNSRHHLALNNIIHWLEQNKLTIDVKNTDNVF